jgi:translocator protein
MSSSTKAVTLQIGNVIAFVLTLVVNGLANTTLIGGRTTADISNLYPTLITPAGYVFAIWGIIYALLFIFIVYHALPGQRNSAFLQKVSFLFILSCVFNVAWLFLWQNNYVTYSIILIVAFLITLEEIYRRLQIGKSEVSLKERVFVHLPFSVYFGWVTVATFANIAVALSQASIVKWEVSDAVAAIVLLAILLVIVLRVLVARKDVAYGLVAVWALVGIAVNQTVSEVVYTAYLGAAIIAGVVVVVALWSIRKKPQKTV